MSAGATEKVGRYARKAPSRGGKREGAGGRAISAHEAMERSLVVGVQADSLVAAAVERLIERVGLPPRRRLLLGERVAERTDGPWLAAFCRELCVQTIGRFNGVPLELYPEQQAFLDDALSFDDAGNRVFSTAMWGIPRKNGKSTTCSALAIGLGSPAEGEGKPLVLLAAGSREQAAPLLGQAVDFARGDDLLRTIFMPSKTAIVCPANGGTIRPVAGDGKLNHGLNPSLVIPDELHAWLTPRQRENWAALTTADGSRDDALIVPITTAGYDRTSILAELLEQARQSPFFEQRPEMGGGGFIVRDVEAKLLVHWYAVAAGTAFDDLDEWKRANPAPWRTKERIRQDLARRTIDESTKRRLYGNEWTSAKDVWIRRDGWARLEDASAAAEAFTAGATLAVGVDASLNHDTTAVGQAVALDDGRIAVRARVYSVRRDVAAHEFFGGDRIELAQVEEYVGVDLAEEFSLEAVAFDPRYFMRSAELLDDQGLTTIKYEPQSREMWDAVQSFYNLVADGKIVHDGDEVLAAHIEACAGVKTDKGWKVSKMRASSPIDAVIAVILAVDLVAQGMNGDDFVFALIDPYASQERAA